jgi:hypothetical protein
VERRIRLIHEVEGHAFVAVEKPDELAIARRCDVVVDGAEVPMISYVQRVVPKPEVMIFPVLAFPEWYPKRPISLEVE